VVSSGDMQSEHVNIAEVQKRIQESLSLWYPDVTDLNSSLVFVYEKEHQWSRQLLFKIVGTGNCKGQEILVKCLKAQDSLGRVQREILGGVQSGNRSEEDGAFLEYKALSLLYEHFGKGQFDGITAVRPLAHFDDINSLVLEYVPGRNLLLMMLVAAKPWAKQSTVQAVLAAADRAGRLAGSLHMIKQGNYPRTESFDGETYHKSLQTKVDVLSNLSIGNRAWSRLNHVLHTVRGLTSGLHEDVTVTYLHSDFYPDNFIVLPDRRVCTVDTMLEWTGPVEKDIGEFLVFARTPIQRLLGGAVVVRAHMLERVTQAFIAGYSQRACYSSRVAVLYQLLALVQRWSSLLLLEQKIPALLMSAYKRIRVNPLMLRYLESISNELKSSFIESK